MSEGFAQSQQFSELAQLPASDPRRKGFEESLGKLTPAERDHWLAVLRETDQLYADVADVSVPRDLQSRLMRIADEPRTVSRWRQLLQMRLTGPSAAFAAMAAVVVVAVAGYLFYQPVPPLPPISHPLDDAMAMNIATRAITADAAATLAISSDDPAKVQSALNSGSYTFPVMMLKPRANLALQGGGMADLGGSPAVFTRWKGDGVNYTLFEFDGKTAGMPAAFQKTTEAPKESAQDKAQHRVVLWAGPQGACAWALVMDSDTGADVFSTGY